MKDKISFADFSKLDLRVGEIMGATVPVGSEALIKLAVDFGEEGKRVIFAGINKWYTPEEIIGKKSVFVLNMEPKKTPFGDSEGMLLAPGSERAYLLEVPEEITTGMALR